MQSIKKIYLYLVSVIALVIWVIGGIILVNMALKTWVFTKADDYYYRTPCPIMVKNTDGSESMSPECDEKFQAVQEENEKRNRTAQKQQQAAQAIAMIVVAAPVWYMHWRWARRES